MAGPEGLGRRARACYARFSGSSADDLRGMHLHMTDVAQSDNRRSYPTLDLLRVIAVSMTLMIHAPSLTMRIPLVKHLTYGLWLGVDLFMLISGWLLGGQVLREARSGDFDVRRFYLKRWLRTLPPYYA